MRLMNLIPILTAIVLSIFCYSSSAAAPQADDDLLAGPKVEEDATKGGRGEMMGPQGGEARRRANDLPFDQWMSVLRGLNLTQEQQDSVRAIAQEFQKAQRDYRQALSEEEQAAMRQAREARQAGEQPSREARELIQKVEANRPKATAYQERIWEELNAEQQEQMKAKLAELREQSAERRQRRPGRNAGQPGESDDMMNQEPRRSAPGNGSTPNQDQMAEQNQMEPSGDQMQNPSARRANPDRRGRQLDDMGRKRLDFLLKHQSKSVKRPGREPAPEERQFDFDEE